MIRIRSTTVPEAQRLHKTLFVKTRGARRGAWRGRASPPVSCRGSTPGRPARLAHHSQLRLVQYTFAGSGTGRTHDRICQRRNTARCSTQEGTRLSSEVPYARPKRPRLRSCRGAMQSHQSRRPSSSFVRRWMASCSGSYGCSLLGISRMAGDLASCSRKGEGSEARAGQEKVQSRESR